MTPVDRSRRWEDYPRDIVERVAKDFSGGALSQVRSLLEELGSDRLARCALFLARGSVRKLNEAVTLGRVDFRDLIMAAEYDHEDRQVRDLRQPFPAIATDTAGHGRSGKQTR